MEGKAQTDLLAAKYQAAGLPCGDSKECSTQRGGWGSRAALAWTFSQSGGSQATKSGAIGNKVFIGAQIDLLQEYPGKKTLLILKMKVPCPIRTGQGVYPCLTGYTKMSLREPVATETLRSVDDLVWAFCPEQAAQSCQDQHPPGTPQSLKDLCHDNNLAPEVRGNFVQRAWAMQRHCG